MKTYGLCSNSGHRRGATIPRCVGKMQSVVEFPVFAATALAGLGDLPDTLMSQAQFPFGCGSACLRSSQNPFGGDCTTSRDQIA